MSTHHFQPTLYYRTIGTHEPALQIADGDTVNATTADAIGYDQHGECVAERGNPMTGPFYVEGAEPGDTLAMHIDSITPNREFGGTNYSLAINVVDPDFVRELPRDDELWKGGAAQWRIDHAAGTV